MYLILMQAGNCEKYALLTEIILFLPFFHHALPFLHFCLFLLNIFISCLLDFKLKCRFQLQGTLHPALTEHPSWPVESSNGYWVNFCCQCCAIIDVKYRNVMIIFSDDNQIIMISIIVIIEIHDYRDNLAQKIDSTPSNHS